MRREWKAYGVVFCLGCAACADGAADSEGVEASASSLAQRAPRPPADPLQNEAELPYLVDPRTRRVVRELPPAVLTDILGQLTRLGMAKEAEHMHRLYDIGSGRVRDPSRVAKAEAALRAGGQEREARHGTED